MISKVMNLIKPCSNKHINNVKNILSCSNVPKFQLFDTSLRDGLQTLPIESHELASTDFKLNLYNEIYYTHSPKYIEVGSVVSPKIFPIFNDTIPFINHLFKNKFDKSGIFILIPDSKKMDFFLQHNIEYPIHFSFITSFSETFQQKNIHKTLLETDKELNNIFSMLQKNNFLYKPILKLYISCFNTCPLEGKIDNNYIVDKIAQYSQLPFDIICLSDTCGTLLENDMSNILESCEKQNIDFNKIGIHLHNNINSNENEQRIQNVLKVCFKKNIVHYDVSLIEHGGCPLAIKNHQLPNLTYKQFFEALTIYIKSFQKK